MAVSNTGSGILNAMPGDKAASTMSGWWTPVPHDMSASSADVQANLDNLKSQVADGYLSAINLTDSGTATFSVSAAQLSQYINVFQHISGSYTLNVTGTSAPIANFIAHEDPARGGDDFVQMYVAEDNPFAVGPFMFNSVIGFRSEVLMGARNAVVLTGTQSQYNLTFDASGGVIIAANTATTDAARGQIAYVSGASYIVFDSAATSGSSYREIMIQADNAGDATVATLYQSTFGRLPDLPGLEAWQHQYDSGNMSLQQIAQAFGGSGEFQSRFGANTSDIQYVDALYTNVLGRGADKSGEAAWVSYLGQLSGSAGATSARATVLLDFAASGEEVTNSASWLTTIGTSHTASAHSISIMG